MTQAAHAQAQQRVQQRVQQRWLVYKVRSGQLETRSHAMWLGNCPKAGENIPANAVAVEMPDTPRNARPYDFVRSSNGAITFQLQNKERPPSQAQIDSALAASEARKKLEAAAEDPTITDQEFQEMKNKLERAKVVSDPVKRKEMFDTVIEAATKK